MPELSPSAISFGLEAPITQSFHCALCLSRGRRTRKALVQGAGA